MHSGWARMLLALSLAAPWPLLLGRGPNPEPPPARPVFEEVAARSGLDFVHFNGATGQDTLAEIAGSGAALFDYDGDGDLDVYLVQGTILDGPLAKAVVPWRGKGRPVGRLFRNDLVVRPDGSRHLRFTDVTEKAGLAFEGYCMGAATGDFDNDGRPDLYVTCLGSNHLFRSRGDGTFEDVTKKAGADDPRWSTSAAFVDYDRDGFLDLYVANYVDFETDPKKVCLSPSSAREYCGPQAYAPVPHRLLHNRGNGTFEDVSERSGIGKERGSGLGVVAADLDGDGWPDLMVANDGNPNFLFFNQHDGTFRNDALMAGVAVNAMGRAMAGMGVDAGDFLGDGREHVFITNIMQDPAALFVNEGDGLFSDRTIASGLVPGTLGKTGFGTGWFDWDNDGWLDLVVTNGAVLKIPEQHRAGDPLPLRQPNVLFRNTGSGTFVDATIMAGRAFATPNVGRGIAFGDIDNDGTTDLLITSNGGPARLFLNRAGLRNRWVGLRLLARSGRDALGARVEVRRPGLPSLWRRAHTDGSYLCASDPRVLVGLGPTGTPRGLHVIWPDGTSETWPAPPTGRYVTIRQGRSPAFE
ncbi:MAG TPA: CRTAC1 family protein [Thermoanaerobaculia bacterium]|nr:CRTAC1 family protein [Thermoanaerobaculia bacterium]